MSHHHQPPHITRVFIACSPNYHNRRAIMEALGSIFIDTLDEQREYYYLECEAMTEIFDDCALGRTSFRLLVLGDGAKPTVFENLHFTHVVAGGDDAFVAKLLTDIGSSEAMLVRLA